MLGESRRGIKASAQTLHASADDEGRHTDRTSDAARGGRRRMATAIYSVPSDYKRILCSILGGKLEHELFARVSLARRDL